MNLDKSLSPAATGTEGTSAGVTGVTTLHRNNSSTDAMRQRHLAPPNWHSHNRPGEIILQRLDKVKRYGKGWVACCPAHEDRDPSLSIKEAEDGKVLLHCFAGCETKDVLAAIGLDLRDLFPEGLSAESRIEYRRQSLAAAHTQAKLLDQLAEANAASLSDDDVLLALKARQDLPRIEAELEALKPKDRDTADNKFNALFHPTTDGFVELPETIRQTVIGKLAQRTAYCLELPEASVFLALLGSASAAVATSYAVQYATGTCLPTGLFTIIEQPPATQKSFLLSIGLRPYEQGMITHNKQVSALNRNEEKADSIRFGFVNATDATSAALDESLANCDSGRFVIASSEQSAFSSLFPESGTYSSNNELLLKGYPGEYVSSLRKGRKAFNGVAYGTIVLVAQPGSAKRVFSASNGSGLAERFLYLSEPSLLGKRSLHGEYLSRDDTADFYKACTECMSTYSSKALSICPENEQNRMEPETLTQLRASSEGYALIMQERKSMESYLGKLADSGAMVMLSWLGKLETHALKIAAVLHVIECQAAGCSVPDVIPSSLVRTALEFVKVIGKHLEQVLRDSGESGDAVEVEAVISLISNERFLGVRDAALKLQRRIPFRAMGKGAYKAARARIEAMLTEGLLMVSTKGKLETV